MSDERPLIEVGWAWNTPMGPAEQAIADLGKIDGIRVDKRELRGLGGPNNVLQFISAHWPFFLTFIATWGGNRSLDALWKNRTAFLAWFRSKDKEVNEEGDKLLNAMSGPVTACAYTETTAVAAIPSLTPTRRGIGMELKSGEPAELAWQLGHLALHAQEIQDAVDLVMRTGATVSFDENPDCSIKIELSDDGVVTISWRTGSGLKEVKKFEPPGEK